jgi:hypothetical protein
MSRTFSNELERALVRPDVEELRSALDGYAQWHLANRTKERVQLKVAITDPILHDNSDFDRSLALEVLAMERFDDPIFLGFVSAGPLESLLTTRPYPSEVHLARILEEARRTERFRWMLSGVWRTSMESTQAMAVKRIVGSVDLNNDPLPPRPWP